MDTSAYSGFRGGHPEVHRLMTAAPGILMPIVVIGELEGAFTRGGRRDENLRSLDEFLSRPYVSVALIARSVAARYGSIWARLRSSGTPIGLNDIWIAATAMEADADLLTFDTDFSRVPDLRAIVLSTGR